MNELPTRHLPALPAPIGAFAASVSVRAFALASDPTNNRSLRLCVSPGGQALSTELWTRGFASLADRDRFLDKIRSGALDLAFLGRLTMAFESTALDEAVDKVVAEARAERRAARQKVAKVARKHHEITLYVRSGKSGRHVLELQRASRDKSEWKVAYDRAIERDRLCDWLRWQKPRFPDFLAHAAEHGDEALSRLLTDEMFETELRIKKEGRGAGGMRPLRMWRGDQ